jgi:peptidyl-prolyl cis-trans isomerase SurA
MLSNTLKVTTTILILLFTAGSVQAQQTRVLDRIVALVNDHIILQSDVDSRVNEFIQNQRGLEFSDELWFEALETVIDHYVLFEQAKIDSIIVTDDEVNRAMDNRINQLISQVGSEEALERAVGQSIIQMRAAFRDNFRREMMVERARNRKLRGIRITRSEVVDFYNEIPQDSIPIVPETVELSQIVVIPPTKQAARESARSKAVALRDSIINHGADIEELARRHSDGPGASRGGFIPLMSMSDLVPEYSAAAAALRPGEVSGVVETQFGFHVIRLNRRVGDQIETNHILIQVGEEDVDEDYAKDKLTALRDSVLHHNKRFSDLARRHSEDMNTAPVGGRISNPRTGERRLVVDDLDPELYRAQLRLLEEGQITEPLRFTTGSSNNRKAAFRIVKLTQRVEEHPANLEQDFDILRNFALQQKQFEVFNSWMEELRNDIYVEYRIDRPQAGNL